ncbi:V-type sodium ATP synthase subunit J [Enterococcus phoeniculicola]|jgi:trk system potassium uptake protein TrkH|uniref:V-type sodium ATP synthase subunit J n=1 Tax=Enterococcus phoeniculicola ATCC BAA-412 TaxID=1158610 RepID=R3WJY8_9ENTE|nr:Trk family potassium uptake protein [Enterococcus phoeniculicola]EOL42215.1 V-type sodium ATP synthase subunit J [Enterococcus phoeniculicola ATCC BAA-412]EOT79506.1 V-type sodium ATP synthase subunit J [Enterococcus phoeniculicola ATCC BAA-412]OJG69801.1 V-type sodium ATP synthase subunit J [Enterococcus phoeniculicola]
MRKKKRQATKQMTAVQLLAVGFLVLILLGGGLLTLPFFSNSGTFTPFIDAVFTATSAVCVTGLTTLNTVEHWNEFGQFLILLLIEIGGLGFMMMPIIFFTLAKKKISLSTRIVLREALNLDEMSGVMNLMIYILKLAGAIQLIGSVALSFVFIPKFGWLKGIWYSVFHSISSFCNAGFDLLGDSLAGYQSNVYVIMVVSALIISGGLGFLVWRDLLNYKKNRRFSLHTQITLIVTVTLLIGGTLVFFFTEQNARLLAPDASYIERFVNTFFMSVTPRTAGYFSIDYAQMSHAGLIMTMFLMYIGGTSGSTAGGLKTTTFGVLVIQMYSMFKGRTRAEFRERTIRSTAVIRALTLFFLTLTLCVVTIMILSITETIPETSGIEYIAFEVFSAFGTVGLTMGLTPELSFVGKIIIISLMYIGRVGVLTVVFSLITKAQRQEAKYKYPEESVMIG